MRTKSRRWVGIDGEGVGKPQRYIMLCAADKKTSWTIETMAKTGLTTHKALSFLLQFSTKDVRLCGFFCQYDFTMIFRDMPNKLIYELFRPSIRALPKDEGGGFSPVYWRGWKLHWINRALTISYNNSRPVTIWDLGQYFQCSFVDALEQWDILSKEERDNMRAMKAQRPDFSAKNIPNIREYCLTECRALALLAEKLESAHLESEIKPRRWYGPGAAAGRLLKSHNINKRKGKPPRIVLNAADIAFAGGRFETRAMGHFEQCHQYDIVSAYPAAVKELPCLEHAEWYYVGNESSLDLDPKYRAVVRYEANIQNEYWGPLHCRTQKNLLFPVGHWRGWAWDKEYRLAKKWGGVYFIGAWVCVNECDCKPFDFVQNLFDLRVKLGKTTKGRVIKLALNAIWGRLAQKVGHPQYASPIWAGIVTSDTRARLLSAILSANSPESIISLATDGLISTEPLDITGEGLGAWEYRGKNNILLVRPGIAIATSVDETRARGLSRHALIKARDAIEQGMLTRASRVSLGDKTLFGGARECVLVDSEGRYVRAPNYGAWYQVESTLSLDPRPKRERDWSPPWVAGIESLPYRATRATSSGEALARLRALAEPSF